MTIDRRKFLKASGVCVLGASLLNVSNVFAGKQPKYSDSAKALKAKRWGMVIDTRKCAECKEKECIAACHREHNVPDIDDEKNEVKWIWSDDFKHVFPSKSHDFVNKKLEERDYLVLCNHCEDPPCVRVCPTQATFKREDGIVTMDYHRCIGCRYCMAACPFGARSFNFKKPRPYIDEENEKYPTRTKGVVEKCNFCAERIADGLPLACAEACKKDAIIFGDLDDPKSEVRKVLESNYTIQRKPELGTGPSVYYIV